MKNAVLRGLSLIVVVAGLVASSAGAAAAQEATVPPLRIGGGAGPAVYFDGGRAQLLLAQEIDYAVVSTDIGRFYVGGALAQQLGDFFLFEVGARVGFDFDVYRGDVVVMVGPSAILGAAIGEGFNGSVRGLFHAQIAAEARALFANGLFGVWIRPFALDVLAGDGGALGRWNLQAGVSVQL